MDGSGLGGGFLSGTNLGFLDLEPSIQRHQQIQFGNPSLTHQHQMNVMGGFDDDHHSFGLRELKGSNRRSFSMNFGKEKVMSPLNAPNSSNASEEDERSYTEEGDNSSGAKGKKGLPWQRMKWIDNVVRLLIAVVACVGDDGVLEGLEGHKRKSGNLQKKGKWKTVSKIMISKGCHVSPQQCEDKFNDLNKRYKKLNDILGRGTSCRVVENPSLMDSMPHLSGKVKDEVRKILSSKHLFYKEMCAYHNGQNIPNCHDFDLQGYFVPSKRCSRENNESEDEEADGNNDSEDDESDNDNDNNVDGVGEGMGGLDERRKGSEENDHSWSQSGSLDRFKGQMASIFEDPTKSLWERREWIKRQTLQLHKQRVGLQARTYELEKQLFKWRRYCSKKDKELERLRLENERLRLENQQSVLQLRQKELEIDFRRPKASFDPANLGIDRLHGDLSRHQ